MSMTFLLGSSRYGSSGPTVSIRLGFTRSAGLLPALRAIQGHTGAGRREVSAKLFTETGSSEWSPAMGIPSSSGAIGESII